ncbi:MurR/RpiR family transcriptional regulator [Schleiferilactobacillus shenzhenensis]|nr:MurR/RpiR family transcriptional regulator [Schleiferilactobacillus shenzhenensis]
MATNVLLAIRERMADLSVAERHVAAYVLAHPDQVLTMSTKALAVAAGASPATVVRFSRRLGATGFADLKLQLSAEHLTDPALLEEITPDEDLEMMKDKLTLRVRQTLQDTNRSLTANALESAVKALQAAQSISVYGVGASLLAATDFVEKFSRLGRLPFLARDPDEAIAHVANQHTPGVVLLISNSGENPHLLALAQAVPEDLTTIVLTKAPASALAQKADIVLQTTPTSITGQMRTAATTSLLAQLYAIDLLYYRFFQSSYSVNVHRIQASYTALQRTRPKKKGRS